MSGGVPAAAGRHVDDPADPTPAALPADSDGESENTLLRRQLEEQQETLEQVQGQLDGERAAIERLTAQLQHAQRDAAAAAADGAGQAAPGRGGGGGALSNSDDGGGDDGMTRGELLERVAELEIAEDLLRRQLAGEVKVGEDLADEVEALQEDNGALVREVAKLKESCQELKESSSRVERGRQGKDAAMEELREECREAQDFASKLERELSALKRRHGEDLERLGEDQDQQLAQKHAELKQLRQEQSEKLAAAYAQLDEAVEQAESRLQQERRHAATARKLLETEVNEAHAQIDSMQTNLEQARAAADSLSGSSEKLRQMELRLSETVADLQQQRIVNDRLDSTNARLKEQYDEEVARSKALDRDVAKHKVAADKLREDLAAASDEARSLRESATAAQARRIDVERALRESEEAKARSISALNDANSTLRATLEATEDDLGDSKERVRSLEAKVRHLEAAAGDAERTSSANGDNDSATGASLDAMEKEVKRLAQELAETHRARQEAEMRAESAHADLTRMREMSSNAKSHEQALAGVVADQASRIDRLLSDKADLDSTVSRLQRELEVAREATATANTAEQDHAKVAEEISLSKVSLSSELDECNAKLRAAREDLVASQADVSAKSSQLKDALTELSVVRSDLHAAVAENDKLVIELSTLTTRSSDSSAEESKDHEELDALRDALESKARQAAGLSDALQGAKERITSQQAELLTLRHAASVFAATEEGFELAVEKLKAEYESRIAVLKSMWKNDASALEEKTKDCKALDKRAQRAEKQLSKLDSKVSTSKSSRMALIEEISEKDKEIEQLRRYNSHLNNRLDRPVASAATSRERKRWEQSQQITPGIVSQLREQLAQAKREAKKDRAAAALLTERVRETEERRLRLWEMVQASRRDAHRVNLIESDARSSTSLDATFVDVEGEIAELRDRLSLLVSHSEGRDRDLTRSATDAARLVSSTAEEAATSKRRERSKRDTSPRSLRSTSPRSGESDATSNSWQAPPEAAVLATFLPDGDKLTRTHLIDGERSTGGALVTRVSRSAAKALQHDLVALSHELVAVVESLFAFNARVSLVARRVQTKLDKTTAQLEASSTAMVTTSRRGDDRGTPPSDRASDGSLKDKRSSKRSSKREYAKKLHRAAMVAAVASGSPIVTERRKAPIPHFRSKTKAAKQLDSGSANMDERSDGSSKHTTQRRSGNLGFHSSKAWEEALEPVSPPAAPTPDDPVVSARSHWDVRKRRGTLQDVASPPPATPSTGTIPGMSSSGFIPSPVRQPGKAVVASPQSPPSPPPQYGGVSRWPSAR